MQTEYYYYFFLSIIILTGILMIAGPHFPNSSVSQQTNNDAFLALTIVGVLITVPFSIWMFKIFKKTTWVDLKNYL